MPGSTILCVIGQTIVWLRADTYYDSVSTGSYVIAMLISNLNKRKHMIKSILRLV